MQYTSDATESRTPHEIAAAVTEGSSRNWGTLVIPPLTLVVVAAASIANSPTDLVVAALTLLALALAAVAFAAAKGS